MIYLQITDLKLSPPVTHTYTDWEVASDLQFTNIIASSLGDTTNLTSIYLDTALDPALKYYARARMLLSVGYTAWSNINIFQPDNVNDSTVNLPLPSIVTIPSVSVGDVNNVSIEKATIAITGVDTLGGATHETTTYVLETLSGKLVWESRDNYNNKLAIDIPPYIMQPNRVYRLRVLVKTDSRDTSQVVTTTFKTETRTSGLIMSSLDSVYVNTILGVDVAPLANVTSYVGELYAIVNESAVLIGSYTATGTLGTLIEIPAGTMKPSTRYVLRINTSDPLIWDHYDFITNA